MFPRALGVLAASALTLCVALPAAASAADGIAVRSGTLRAGPASDYPAVGHIHSGEQLTIYGCVTGYTWCDVSDSGSRGWFPGARIGFLRNGHRAYLPDVAPDYDVGIVGFGVDQYWQDHYRDRPFYRRIDRFHDHGGQSGPDRGPGGHPPIRQPDTNAPPLTPPVRHDDAHGPQTPGHPRFEDQRHPRPDAHAHPPEFHGGPVPVRPNEPPHPPENHVRPPEVHSNPAPQHVQPPVGHANPPPAHEEAPKPARPPEPAQGCNPLCGK